MSERIIRTFISVTLPKKIVSLSEMLKTTVVAKKDNVNWVNPGGIHLTLKFLGNTPAEAIDDINKILNAISLGHKSMDFEVCTTGCFPKVERPRVLWLGVDGGINPLQNYVSNIETTLRSMGLDIEVSEFIPHITVARIKYPPKEIPDISNFMNASFEPIEFNISRIRFMSSELFPNGPIYSILGTHFLGK